MLQNTAERISGIIPQQQVMVVTNERYTQIIAEQLPMVLEKNIIGEPVAKNTAPCVAIAAALLENQDPDAVMVVLPADHHITMPEAFLYVLEKAVSVAKKGDDLVTIGIQPSFAETGFGYIEANVKGTDSSGVQQAFQVMAFKEKPDQKTAEYFLEQDNYFWNSGMFVWKASRVLQEIQEHLPVMYELLERAKPEFGTDLEAAAIKDFYMECESISIDYGIMEKASSVKVVPGSFGWNDVGSWSAVYELSEKDNESNALEALNYCLVDSNNNLIFSKSEKMIALVGVENMAVVETEKALLICDLHNAQGVKQVVEQLKASQELKIFT
jgi:mannose-1-phosphate guanylyltransferase